MTNCNLKYFCEQCGDCLECYAEFDCTLGGENHGVQLTKRLEEEKDKEQ